MSEPRLLEGERLILDVSPTPNFKRYVALRAIIAELVILAMLNVIVAMTLYVVTGGVPITTVGIGPLLATYAFSYLVLAAIVIVLTLVLTNLMYKKYHYWVTDKRVVWRHGVIGYSITSVPLERISDNRVFTTNINVVTTKNSDRGVVSRWLGMNKVEFGRKLPASIVALVLTVFLAALLLYSNIVVSPDAADGSEPLFDVDVTYGYVERPANLSANVPIFNVVLNFTRYSEVELCDAIFEVHLIEVYSDEGSIGNVTKAQGIMFNHSISTLRQAWGLKFDEFAEYGHVPSGASASWPVNHSALLFFVGDKTTCVPDFGEPETVFVRVSRLGLVTLKGDSSEAVVLSEPEVVAEAQLEKFGDGFLYNTIIAEDQLSEIDLLNPPIWVFFE